MRILPAKAGAVLMAGLVLSGCVTMREDVLAPSSSGIVLDARTGAPVKDALVRYAGIEGVPAVTSGPDGGFRLDGLTDRRAMVVLPVSGVFRDARRIVASAPGMAQGYASAVFINRGGPARALDTVTVLLFEADAGDTPLHPLMRDCLQGPEQEHALHLAAHAAAIDPQSPPEWLDEKAADALYEHLWRVLPAHGFQSCAQMTTAYELFRAQTERLREVSQYRRERARP
jgi:hypothetical protein